MNPLPAVVLYAEDSDDDAFLMQRAFTRLKFPGALKVVSNGMEAKRYLQELDAQSDRERLPLPRVILLDIKMPHLNGLEVLKWIRDQEAFRSIPVFMLTSSSQPADVETAFATGATGYLLKPTSLHEFTSVVEDVAAICLTAPGAPQNFCVHGSILPSNGAAVSAATTKG